MKNLTESLKIWFKTGGKKQLEEATRRAMETTAHLEKIRQINPNNLEEPFGPIDESGLWPHQK